MLHTFGKSLGKYNNSLILRCSITEYPFRHKKAFSDVKNNFIYHKDFIPLLFRLIKKKGVYNIGGKSRSIYNFAKKDNNKIKKIKSRGMMPLRLDMNLSKLNSIIKK